MGGIDMAQPIIKILYEDNHLLVVEKPVNVPSQKDESNDADILTILKDDIKVRYNKSGNVYLGLVHRLDRPVGGAMVFAKTSKAASRLSEQIRNHQFKKVYLAVLNGKPDSSSGRLNDYLLKNEKTNTVKVVNKSTPEPKKPFWTMKSQKRGRLTLVRIRLHTGRSHQIRVQFSNVGYPLYGDQKYGADINKAGQQIALWSYEISLVHPTLKQEMTFKCNPPD
jgi:23S rRNA pseudouridine1911/1915/1917 synthase